MKNGRYVSYLRVSSKKQGDSGLGIESQRQAVESYLDGGKWKLVKEFVEVESGKKNDRPALDVALRACRLQNATLIVGKLDRLARNAEFLLKIVRESGPRGVVFCDLPDIPEGPSGKLIITQVAAVAEFEGACISARTKAALAAAKRRGTVLGGKRGDFDIATVAAKGRKASLKVRQANAAERRADLQPVIDDIHEKGIETLSGIAKELNEREVTTAHGYQWTAGQVKRLLTA